MIDINDDLQPKEREFIHRKVLHVASKGNKIAIYGSVTEGIKLR